MLDVDQALAELRRLQQQKIDPKPSNNIANDLASIFHFLEELRPESAKVHKQIESSCSKLQQFTRDLEALQFNGTSFTTRLERVNSQMNTDNLDVKLKEAAGVVVDGLTNKILQYAKYINHSVTILILF